MDGLRSANQPSATLEADLVPAVIIIWVVIMKSKHLTACKLGTLNKRRCAVIYLPITEAVPLFSFQ